MKVIGTGSVLLLLLMLMVSACQQEIDFENLTATQNDSAYLSKMIAVDTTLPAGAETVEKTFFSYDARKRLVKINFRDLTDGDSVREEFFYAGNDTLPYKRVYHDFINFPVASYYRLDMFYTYQQGKVLKDSVIEWDMNGPAPAPSGATVTIYNDQGSQVIKTKRYYNYIAGNHVFDRQESNTYMVTRLNGNIVSYTDTTSFPPYYETIQTTYDNKFNPLNKIFKVQYPAFEFLSYENTQSQLNNPLTRNYVDLNGPGSDTFSYVYRNDGYPVICRSHEQPGNRYTKFSYYYTAL